MPTTTIHTDSIRLRSIEDDSRLSGLTVHLLPEGGTAPGDLIALTQDEGIEWQYNFPVQIENGLYDLYIDMLPAQVNFEQIQVRVMRGGIVQATDTDFIYE